MENFDAFPRLSDDPYPKDNRPRGQADLDSVKYHRRVIRHRGEVEPIYYMERKRRIPAFLIESESANKR